MNRLVELTAELRAGLEGVTPGPYEGRDVRGMNVPAGCVDYGVISLSTHREVHRTWALADARLSELCSPENIALLLDTLATQAARIEQLEREWDRAILHCSAWEDSARINLARAEAAEAQVAGLQKALEPFAAVAERLDSHGIAWGDDYVALEPPALRHFRRARALTQPGASADSAEEGK